MWHGVLQGVATERNDVNLSVYGGMMYASQAEKVTAL